MSEQRFTYKEFKDNDLFGFAEAYDNGKRISTNEMVDLLNEQQATIEEQNKEIEESSAFIIEQRKENKTLKEENEQLKQKLENLDLNEKNDTVKMIDGKVFIRM